MNRGRNQPTLEIKYVPHLGEVGCGTAVEAYDNVFPFIPKDELCPVALPVGVNAQNIGMVTVRGPSLSDFGIWDGDELVIRTKFAWREIDEDRICIVFIHATQELVAKRIVKGANTITLKASGGGVRDMEYSMDEVEIRAIVIKVQFDVSRVIARSREANVRATGIGRRRLHERNGNGTSAKPAHTARDVDDMPY